MSYPFTQDKGHRAVLLAALLALAQVANAAGFFAEWLAPEQSPDG
jgi:hypothetical protein